MCQAFTLDKVFRATDQVCWAHCQVGESSGGSNPLVGDGCYPVWWGPNQLGNGVGRGLGGDLRPRPVPRKSLVPPAPLSLSGTFLSPPPSPADPQSPMGPRGDCWRTQKIPHYDHLNAETSKTADSHMINHQSTNAFSHPCKLLNITTLFIGIANMK